MFAIKYEIIHYIPGTAAYNSQSPKQHPSMDLHPIRWSTTKNKQQSNRINR